MVLNPDPVGFGVYVHWPFCAAKCPYCDFNSHVRAAPIDEERYLGAYRQELAYLGQQLGRRQVSSIFLGGGTPSLLAPKTVGGLLDAVSRTWEVAGDCEVTLEANPNSVEAARFADYRAAGVNRVSIGVQALDDLALRQLGRLHSAAEAKAAVAIAERIFDNFNFDLIYARPNQTLGDWRRELDEGLAMAGKHLSLYQLTIESGTAYAALFAAGKLILPEATCAEDMFELAQELTTSAGLPAYEISNHARPGDECQHNLLYWRYGEYAGVGPGAHGRVMIDGERFATVARAEPEAWLQEVNETGHGLISFDVLRADEMADEVLLMGLRLAKGLDLQRLRAIGGVAPGASVRQSLVDAGLLVGGDGSEHLMATRQGRFVLNRLIAELSQSFQPVSR